MDMQQLILHPPRDWQVFEDLCRALWEREWRCATIQQHGRSGQTQLGVDIYGSMATGERKLIVIVVNGAATEIKLLNTTVYCTGLR
jgi:hypothetical protein